MPVPGPAPIVGYAKTVKIKSKDTFKASDSYMARRMDYLDYVAAGRGRASASSRTSTAST